MPLITAALSQGLYLRPLDPLLISVKIFRKQCIEQIKVHFMCIVNILLQLVLHVHIMCMQDHIEKRGTMQIVRIAC